MRGQHAAGSVAVPHRVRLITIGNTLGDVDLESRKDRGGRTQHLELHTKLGPTW